MQIKYSNDVATNICVYGLEESMVASGYPMATSTDHFERDVEKTRGDVREFSDITVNPHYKRGKLLGSSKPASGHNCYLKGIVVQFDLSFSQIAWQQWQRYHFADIISSQSKMHRAVKMDLWLQCIGYVDDVVIERCEQLKDVYLETNDKKDWKRFVYSLPTGLLLTARVTTNYLQLVTMYEQRKHHKLDDEWGQFCDMCDELPYFNELTGVKRNEKRN